MPNAPVQAAGEAVPAYSLDDIICDTCLLRHLLDATVNILCDMDYGGGETRNHRLDQVNALVNIAANDLGRIVSSIDVNYGNLRPGRSA